MPPSGSSSASGPATVASTAAFIKTRTRSSCSPSINIIARQHGGLTDADNLCLSCFRCNSHKGPNIASLDPETGELVRLFHPRRDDWSEHFEWNGALLAGHTAIGRVTVALLAINHPEYVLLRESLIDEGSFPPS